MTDFIKAWLEEGKARHRRERTFFALIALLSVVTVGMVFWQLRQTGISATADAVCGLEEHVHTEQCYETRYICGLEEGQEEAPGHTHGPECYEETLVLRCEKEPHAHGDGCYTEEQVLTCTQQAHTHGEACYASDGSLLCTLEEHTHGDGCYTVERRLTCALEEHTHDEGCYEGNKVLICTLDESEPIHHTHTDACREKVLVCAIPEHTHDETCLPDLTADVEDTEALRRNAANPGTGIWNSDLLAVAKAQLGYQESSRNFTIDESGIRHGYTRYGESYGDPYGPWDGMFLAYCLRYSGVPETVAPQRAGVFAMLTECAGSPWLKNVSASGAQPGDIVFFDGTAGIVSLGGETLQVICGDVAGAVQERTVSVESVSQWIAVGEAYAAAVLPVQAPTAEDYLLPKEEESPSPENAKSADGLDENQQSEAGESSGTDGSLEESIDLSLCIKSDPEPTLLKWDGSKWTDNFDKTKMNDGDKVKFSFTYEIPHGTRGDSPTAYYRLPDGILPDKTSGTIYSPDGNQQIGSYKIQDGVVVFTYDQDFWNTGSAIGGNFELEGTLDRSQLGSDAKISFPGTGVILDVRGYIEAEKTAAKKFIGDELVFQYSIKVSTKNSTGPGTITISDALNTHSNSSPISVRGYYITDSIKCYGHDGAEIPLVVGKNLTWSGLDTDRPSFEITGLPALSKGQTYRVVYDIRLPRESFDDPATNAINDVKIYNSAKAQCPENAWTDNERCSFSKRIQKDGTYDRSTGRIKWTITVNNPGDQKQYLTGYRLTDTLPQGLNIVSDVLLYAEKENGTLLKAITAESFRDNGFLFEESTRVCKNYVFVFYTDVPASETALRLTNVANLQKGETTFTASKSLDIVAGDWEAAKTLLRTDGEIAYWSFYAVNSTGAKDFTVTDTIGSREGADLFPLDHYGIAAEIQNAIEKNLRVEMQNGTLLSYEEAADSLEIVYLDADGNSLRVGDGGHVAKFTITFRGDFVKSIRLTDYPTHMDRASVLLAHTRVYYNTLQVGNSTSSAQTEYKNEKDFEKLVSTDGGKTFTWGGTAAYSEGMTLLYRLELQVSAGEKAPVYDTLPEGSTLDGTPTVTIDGGTPRNIVPTVNGQTLTFAIADWLPDENAHRLVIQYRVKLNEADWADKMKAEGQYTNAAQWGQERESVTTTVRREIPPLEKTAVMEPDQTGLLRRVKYTVYVNLGKMDFQKNYLTLSDTISVDTSKVKVELDLSSVELHYYDYQTQSSEPLPEGTYQILDSNAKDYLLKISVPNRTAIVLTYECTFTLLSPGEYQIQNKIALEDYEQYNSTFPIKLSTDAASAYAGQLKLFKVDPLGKPLSGAVFQAAPYEQDDQGNWTSGTAIMLREATKGYFSVGVSTDGANGTLKINTLYRIWESDAPAGYRKDEESRYVLFYNTSLQRAQALAASIPEVEGKTILYSAHTATLSMKVENAPEKLTIQKQWMDPDNKPLADPGVTQIRVRLLRKTDQGKDEAFSKELTITEDEDWKLTLELGQDGIDAVDGDGNPYYYYIEEIDPPDHWNVSYLNNGGVRTGTIYVQNRVYSFKLPETGGVGTNRFLYIGGALMLCSGILLRKRGKRK